MPKRLWVFLYCPRQRKHEALGTGELLWRDGLPLNSFKAIHHKLVTKLSPSNFPKEVQRDEIVPFAYLMAMQVYCYQPLRVRQVMMQPLG